MINLNFCGPEYTESCINYLKKRNMLKDMLFTKFKNFTIESNHSLYINKSINQFELGTDKIYERGCILTWASRGGMVKMVGGNSDYYLNPATNEIRELNGKRFTISVLVEKAYILYKIRKTHTYKPTDEPKKFTINVSILTNGKSINHSIIVENKRKQFFETPSALV